MANLKEALKIQKKHLGDEHPDAAKTLDGMGKNLQNIVYILIHLKELLKINIINFFLK